MINNQNKEQIDEFIIPALAGAARVIGKWLLKNPGKAAVGAGAGAAAAGAALSGDEEENKKTDEKEETPSEQTPPKETEPKETPPPMTVPDAGAAGKMGPPAPEPPKPAGVEGGLVGPPTEEDSPPPTWQEIGKEAAKQAMDNLPSFEDIYNTGKEGLEGLADRAQKAIDYVKSGKGPFGKGGTVNMLDGSRQNVDIKDLEADARRGLAKVGRTLDARKKRGADQRQDLGEPETVRERDPRFQMSGGGRGFAGRNEQITYDYLSAFFGQELNECIDNISEEQLQEAVDLINLVRVKLADRVS